MDDFNPTLCAVDGKDYGTVEELNKAIRWTHKLTQEKYYNKYFPRKDLLTGDFIKFKSVEYYLSNLWNDRKNMNSYLSTKNSTEITEIVKQLLTLRKTVKKVLEAPTQVEARTIIFPMPQKLVVKGIDYADIARQVGMKTKYAYSLGFDTLLSTQETGHKIIIDTREQKPLKWKEKFVHTETGTLKYGDYKDEYCRHKLVFERKSLNDYIGTMSRGFDRFRAECARARDDGAGMVVLIEANFNKAQSFNYGGRSHSQCTPEFIFSQMRKIMKEFSDVQFLFVDGRIEAARVMRLIFSALQNPMKYDLQFSYDLGRFTT